ncbi:hypothetical protein OC834_000756 [Tilletia horrida]|uniref:NADP-dependent oxidoreductase domain-containing protein n=1 Tax=Tilletia horrida TaxID=155126 RepID=A0AAN6JJR6_9BASI|nr:hypothetical protein OC842_004551 [Tilletia horrida]KAK0537513.1 hypothetical protein OC834_000756 [Tilletia horrida]
MAAAQDARAAAAGAHAPAAALDLGPRIPMPTIIYGTAWKGPASTPLVLTALRAGFRAVDTAAQLKHYDEAAVGQGIRDALAAGAASTSAAAADPELQGLTRSQLWIQTKCTPPAGQDWSRPVPYERTDRPANAVRKSFALSLWNLATDEGWREAHPPLPGYGRHARSRSQSNDPKGKQRDFSGSTSKGADGPEPSPLDLLSDAAVSLLPSGAAAPGEGQAATVAAAATAATVPAYPAPGSPLYPHLRPRTSAAEPYIDSYLLHSPFDSLEDTVEAWREMENLVRLGWIRRIGLSNVYDPRILQALRTYFVNSASTPLGHAEPGGGGGGPTYPIAPTILQNRWHNSTLHDVSLFSILSPTLSPNDFADIAGRIQSQKEAAEGALAAVRQQVDSLEPRQLEAPQPETDDPGQVQAITYQAFWILTGNPSLLTRPAVLENVQIVNAYLPQSISPPLPERPAESALQRAIRSTRWTPQMLLYATVALGLGGVPGLSTAVLCGSTDNVHMVEALVAVHRAENLRAAELGFGRGSGSGNGRDRGASLGPKEREREEAHNVALREAVDAIRREVYGE